MGSRASRGLWEERVREAKEYPQLLDSLTEDCVQGVLMRSPGFEITEEIRDQIRQDINDMIMRNITS